MPTLNISLPKDLKMVVDERVADGHFASHSEYLRSLIRQDQEFQQRQRLEDRLLERLESGESVPMGHADFAKIQNRLKGRLARRKKDRR